MKTLMFTVGIIVLSALGCNAQKEKKANDVSTSAQSQIQPQVSWKVSKQVDENGNTVRYDSTYVWSYSNQGPIHPDSLMVNFSRRFRIPFAPFLNSGSPYRADSIPVPGIVLPDNFRSVWQHYPWNIRSMFFDQIDSVQKKNLQPNRSLISEQNEHPAERKIM